MRFIWPLDTHVISRDFYYRASIYIGGQHMAVDIPASSGTPIKAAAAGRVARVGYSDINGHYVEITHGGGWYTKYRHLVESAAVVSGGGIAQGQVIGKVGSTGWSTGPHLHLDLWNSSKQSPEAVYKSGWWAHDPELYLGKEDDDMDEAAIRQLIKEAIVDHEQIPHYSAGDAVRAHEALVDVHLNIQQIKENHGPHGDSVNYTDADAVKAVKDALPD